MKKVNRSHQLSRRQALIGLTGFAAATPVLATQGTNQESTHPAATPKESIARPLVIRGRDQSFDQDWRFHRGDVSGAENQNFDDSQWRKLDLPHDWSIEDLTPVSEASGEGTVWVGGNAPTRLAPLMWRSVRGRRRRDGSWAVRVVSQAISRSTVEHQDGSRDSIRRRLYEL